MVLVVVIERLDLLIRSIIAFNLLESFLIDFKLFLSALSLFIQGRFFDRVVSQVCHGMLIALCLSCVFVLLSYSSSALVTLTLTFFVAPSRHINRFQALTG